MDSSCSLLAYSAAGISALSLGVGLWLNGSIVWKFKLRSLRGSRNEKSNFEPPPNLFESETDRIRSKSEP